MAVATGRDTSKTEQQKSSHDAATDCPPFSREGLIGPLRPLQLLPRAQELLTHTPSH